MTKESAFHPKIAARTDQWMDLFGYWAPSVVTDAGEEYRAVRETAGLMDFSMLRKVDLAGERAIELVNSFVTRDVTKLKQQRIAYGALCDDTGKMVDDCTTMLRSEDRVRFCGANDKDVEFFRTRADELDVQIREFTDDMPHLCVQGPRSRDILQPILNQDISGPAFPYYTFREDVEVAGIPVFMTRMGYTAELGYELWVDRDRALDLWDVLVEAGTPAGMAVIGMDALDLFRIEGGFIIGGIEYDSTVSPFECGLGWAVKLAKGPFQGSEALARDKEANRVRLTSVVLGSGADKASGASLSAGGTTIGTVTQAIASPYLGGKTLGLAKVDRDYLEPGTAVQASFDGATVPGEIVAHPVYEAGRERAKNS